MKSKKDMNTQLQKMPLTPDLMTFKVDESHLSPLLKGLFKNASKHLSPAFDTLKLAKKFEGQKTINVLSLGCGYAAEIIPLFNHLSQKNISMIYKGVDNNSQIIEDCKKFSDGISDISFDCVDAGNYENLLPFLKKDSIDLAILRHPEFFTDENTSDSFKKILLKTIPYYLKNTGLLFFTCAAKEEQDEIIKLISPQAPLPSYLNGNQNEIEKSAYSMKKLKENMILCVVPDKFASLYSVNPQLKSQPAVLAEEEENEEYQGFSKSP